MHRLISAKSFYQNSVHNIFMHSNNSVIGHTDIKCSFCRKILLGQPNIESLMVSRHQSTRTANALRSQKKRAKHKINKKFGELLEVSEKAMTETKVSISNLRPAQLSKLASSPVSLGQLHQLTAKPKKLILKEVDPELLQSVKEKILKRTLSTTSNIKEIVLEDDKCALIFTNHSLPGLKDTFKSNQAMHMVKESYYNFRKATLYDQRLRDLRFAINEGLNQEFDFETPKLDSQLDVINQPTLRKSPHAVFKEIFIDNQLDSYDQELITHISNLQTHGLPHPAIEDIEDDPALHSEIGEIREDIDFDHNEDIDPSVQCKSLNIKKAQQELRKKRKAKREARRARQEVSMKEDMRAVERRGARHAQRRLLAAHTVLLTALGMNHECKQVLQYYRQRAARETDNLKVTDVKIYNTLLHGYAAQGDIPNVRELLSFMREDSVAATAQTYAAAVECAERAGDGGLLRECWDEMRELGISLNDLLDKSKFINDQSEVVLRAIRRLEPDFEPHYTPPDMDYDCPLLEKLKLDQLQNRQGLNISPVEGVLSAEEIQKLGEKQLEVELNGEIEVLNIDAKDEITPNVKFCRERVAALEEEWRSAVRSALQRNLATLRAQAAASHAPVTLYPYLKVLQEDQLVELIMGEVSKLVDGSESYSPTLSLLQRDLGTLLYHKYQIEQFRHNGMLAKFSTIYAEYCQWYAGRPAGESPLNARQAWQMLVHKHRGGVSLDVEETPWPLEMRQNVGKFLYNIIINDMKIDVNMFKPKAKEKKLPAVYKVHRPWGRLVRLELKPHPALARLWLSASRPKLRMRAPLVPAAAPPRPWTGLAAGAYLLTPTPLIRMPYYVVNQWRRLEEAPAAALRPALDALNQLAEVPWTVNRPVLDLQLSIFRSGGNKKLEIAPPASSLDLTQFEEIGAPKSPQGAVEGPESPQGGKGGTESPQGGKGGTESPQGGKGDAAAKFRRRLAVNRARAEMHSLWCDALYKLSLANHYRDSIFWLPHNLDFRGRVYACPPHLSQLGADAARALLLFARKEPLGRDGLRWLKLHCVNLTGTMKKNTIDERLEYAESVMGAILDSADRPLDGDGWWMQSEEPWQTLACCMEIANAVRSPNHEEYRCGFPVHQDGSCNGLQHYAALGGDAAGAFAVNLAPAARPQDVYSAVAAKVEDMRIRDAALGVPAAVALEGFVRRKVIKQTVMTTVYGVTRFGARLQIAKQLKDIEEFPKDQVWPCSQYLTARTFDSLREMFTSTKLIQDWLTDCAKMISGVCGESVEWVTPLGLRVVQPYHRRAPHAAAAALARTPQDHHQRPCTMKQRNAFPPNFIHSLDSAHMMLTGLHCQAEGIAFVSVHDCFWTHPHTTHVMNQICREQFVALHSQPILDDLSEFLVKRYSYEDSELEEQTASASNKRRVNRLLGRVPGKGDFDLRSVLRSVYFFS